MNSSYSSAKILFLSFASADVWICAQVSSKDIDAKLSLLSLGSGSNTSNKLVNDMDNFSNVSNDVC
ncbi:hypothetical protein Bpfe_015042 [Biomphalaria pfeifferi]|uniref:Uncharacterized protein n=1 Tax=Biomphalaria pfeifferi TaxID=112525 RepID=A0AAD8BJK6_BIOPF|nr:hypothetical protein Bpfe_015042 [Biomphalaria pfeifferi]